jgi:hypothetical protein
MDRETGIALFGGVCIVDLSVNDNQQQQDRDMNTQYAWLALSHPDYAPHDFHARITIAGYVATILIMADCGEPVVRLGAEHRQISRLSLSDLFSLAMTQAATSPAEIKRWDDYAALWACYHDETGCLDIEPTDRDPME